MAQLTSSRPRRGRRTAAALATTSLVVAGLGFTTAPANAHPTGDRAVNAGADWLTGQLTNGIVHNDQFGGFDDFGLSADFAFALKAVGRDATATSIVTAIEPKSESWVAGYTPGRVYAGSLAKLVSLAQAAGKDASAFNGVDQVTRLEGLVSSAAPITGRLEDAGVDPDPASYDADFVNVIGQSFAARALTTAGSGKAGDVTGFLLTQQCTQGFFRATLTADKAAAEQGCASGDTPSVDTTALSVINLLDTPGASTAAKDAAAAGVAWLKTQQATDGSFSAGGAEGDNANSTGLAGWALTKASETTAATTAAGWLRGVQIADLAPCATTLTADNGGLAYKPGILATARSTGIAPGQRDQFRRATAQALPALANVPAGTGPLSVSAPATALEKSTVTVTVAGLGAGEAGCVTFGSVAKPVIGSGASVPVTFDLPSGAALHTFTLTTLAGSQSATTNATLTPAPATPEVGQLKTGKVKTAKHNKFTLRVTCDDIEACNGKLVVRTTHKVKSGSGKARKHLIAKKTYSVAPGTTKKVVLKVRRSARSALDSRRIRVKAVQTAPGADRSVTKFWLRSK